MRRQKVDNSRARGVCFSLLTSHLSLRLVRELAFAALIALIPVVAWADEPSPKAPVPASRSVREGNRFLQGGNPAAALERYREAKLVEPTAREIAFDEGLAHYALGEFDEARESFDRGAAGEADALADDAVYSAGTCDHTQALGQGADPKQSLGKLEDAMQRYQSVLSRRPEHQAARDANRKAATLWREIKQQMQQQEQSQDQSQDGESQQREEQSESQQQQEQQQKQQQDESHEQQSSASQQEQQEKTQEQQASADQPPENGEEEQQAAEAREKEEEVSREQAERKLREIMQAMKDRNKHRREEVRRAPPSPVEKDW